LRPIFKIPPLPLSGGLRKKIIFLNYSEAHTSTVEKETGRYYCHLKL
jgi:hypothetical protein